MKRSAVRYSRGAGVLGSLVVGLCSLLCAANGDSEAERSKQHRDDSNAVARAMAVLSFDTHEQAQPRYSSTVTNWHPRFPVCDGITNITLRGESAGDQAVTQDYLGIDRDNDRWVRVSIDYFQTSRRAHEHLIKTRSSPSAETSSIDAAIRQGEVTNSARRVGFRCFRNTLSGRGEEMVFIRNNLCISIFGKGVEVEHLARDLDRQIIEISGPEEDVQRK